MLNRRLLYFIPLDLANALVHVANYFLEQLRRQIEVSILAARAGIIDLFIQISIQCKDDICGCSHFTLAVAEPLGPYVVREISKRRKQAYNMILTTILIFFPHHLLFLFMLPYCLWFKATIIELLFSLGPHAP